MIRLFLLVLLLFTGCTDSKSKSKRLASFAVKEDSRTGCFELTDSYCKFLYDPSSQGNIEVVRPKGNIAVLQGETENDFSQAYFHYSQAKLRRKNELPRYFAGVLDELGYFPKLTELLARPARKFLTITRRVQYDRLSMEVDRIWTTAINETVLSRLAAKFPLVHQIRAREMPPEYDIEAQKIRRKLYGEIASALWREDRNWMKVVETFRSLQTAYLAVIARIDASPELKDRFERQIKSVKLVLPGSIPEISDTECSSTKANAYYYRYLNIITVCAGDFNSEDILQSLAHELGHAIDVDRTGYLFKMESDLVREQRKLRQQICSTAKVDCAMWDAFKKDLNERLEYFEDYRPDLPRFNQCLQRRPVNIRASDSDIRRVAVNLTRASYSSLAGADFFLRIIKQKLPLRSGKLVKNPYYMNPCGYYLWTREEEPPEDEINSLTYFTAEYKCSAEGPDQFKNAIDQSKEISERVRAAMLSVDGIFSDNELMVKEGYASPSSERYADVLGSYAMAEFLRKFPALADRRGKLLASVSWLCSEPSLQSHYPLESQVESDYGDDAHAEGFLRFQEILSAPLRNELQCQKDFEFDECELPMSRH